MEVETLARCFCDALRFAVVKVKEFRQIRQNPTLPTLLLST